MANKITDAFSNIFGKTKDATQEILKDQAKSAASDITSKVTDITGKAKSVFDDSPNQASSFFDTIKNKFNALSPSSAISKPIATSEGGIKFITPPVSSAGKKSNKLFKSKKGMLIVGVSVLVGIIFLVKPKRRK